MIEMSNAKNKDAKRKLIDAKCNNVFVFKKLNHTPFIGNDYAKASEKILFIGNQKVPVDEKSIRNKNKREYPIFNICSQIVNSNDKLQKFIQTDLKMSAESVSYYNFFFNRHDESVVIPSSGASGEELTVYHQALALIIEALKPNKIVFWGKDVLTKVKRIKRPKAFKGRTFSEFTQNNEISVETVNIHNISSKTKKELTVGNSPVSGKSELETCIDDISMISKEMYTSLEQGLDGNLKQIQALNEMYYYDIEPDQDLFKDGMHFDDLGTWSFFLCLKKINRIHRSLERVQKKLEKKDLYQTKDELKMEKTISYSQWMLRLLQENDLYIAHTLVPSMLKYIENAFELEDEMIPELGGEASLSKEGFCDYLKKHNQTDCRGIGSILKSVYLHFKNSVEADSREYSLIMKKRIFIVNDKRKFNDVIDKKMLDVFIKDKVVKVWTPNSIIEQQES